MIVTKSNMENLRGKAGIYQWKNPSGYVYIGSAVCLLKRLRGHLAGSSNPHLRNSIAKHGFEAHELSVLEFIEVGGLTEYGARKEILSAEQRWIDNGFAQFDEKMMNVSPTAGSSLGVKHTDETRQRRSVAMNRPDVKFRQSVALKESQNRPEVKARISVAQKESWNRPEVKARRSAASRESSSRPDVIAQRIANGGMVRNNVHVEGHGTFRSVRSAFDELGIHERGVGSGVHIQLRMKLKKAGSLAYREPNGTVWNFSVI